VGPALSSVAEAVAALRNGGVVVLPTDTVYGLVAKADLPDAVDRIFDIKERPPSKTLQLLVGDESSLDTYGRPGEEARKLAALYWPGPLTIIVAASEEAPPSVTADGRIGMRAPGHDIALEIIRDAGALAATSANRSTEPTPAGLEAIRSIFTENVDVYVDGGKIEGRASTVVDMTQRRPIVVREGAITADEIMRAAGFGFESG
jgi:L-threonylcarbamoyladenylate synthase